MQIAVSVEFLHCVVEPNKAGRQEDGDGTPDGKKTEGTGTQSLDTRTWGFP